MDLLVAAYNFARGRRWREPTEHYPEYEPGWVSAEYSSSSEDDDDTSAFRSPSAQAQASPPAPLNAPHHVQAPAAAPRAPIRASMLAASPSLARPLAFLAPALPPQAPDLSPLPTLPSSTLHATPAPAPSTQVTLLAPPVTAIPVPQAQTTGVALPSSFAASIPVLVISPPSPPATFASSKRAKQPKPSRAKHPKLPKLPMRVVHPSASRESSAEPDENESLNTMRSRRKLARKTPRGRARLAGRGSLARSASDIFMGEETGSDTPKADESSSDAMDQDWDSATEPPSGAEQEEEDGDEEMDMGDSYGPSTSSQTIFPRARPAELSPPVHAFEIRSLIARIGKVAGGDVPRDSFDPAASWTTRVTAARTLPDFAQLAAHASVGYLMSPLQLSVPIAMGDLAHLQVLYFTETGGVDMLPTLEAVGVCERRVVIGHRVTPATFADIYLRSAGMLHIALLRVGGALTLAYVTQAGRVNVFHMLRDPLLQRLPDHHEFTYITQLTLCDNLLVGQLQVFGGYKRHIFISILRIIVTGESGEFYDNGGLLPLMPNLQHIVFAASVSCGTLKLVDGDTALSVSADQIFLLMSGMHKSGSRPRLEYDGIEPPDLGDYASLLDLMCEL
ncbi:hypothetical protein EXIGLDRAFT_771545 [Exidia glandulosa HHB12029]|uniref:Uncharacterized protein n=1 Tax=Exidia glandulosa HHB12029 TaxID=1314781 RepID=A0A165FWI2_EXIGL|nr:hypothetical protein EXIGLDRAFT_771545 [Exidia glandulosa HHB12029]